MRVIVTRPAAQADAWVARLAARGQAAVALPLIAIEAPPDPGAVDAAWRALGAQALVVFVSPNAAERFYALRPEGTTWPQGTRAAAVGPGTVAALRDAGLGAEAIVSVRDDAAQFDSEALWSVLGTEPWAGRSALVVRGDGGREWLAERLREAGARVEHVAAYRRAAPRLDAHMQRTLAAALADPAAHVWLFSSSEAIEHLDDLTRGHDWRAARAIATHPRIAARAAHLGIGDVRTCRPDLDAVLGCIESLRPPRMP